MKNLAKFKSKIAAGFTGMVTAMVGSYAMAQATAVDTTAVTDELTANVSAIEAIGAAILGLAVVAVIFKWLKGMIFS